MKKFILSCLYLMSIPVCVNASTLFNMSYVEVNSNALSNIGCYLRQSNHQPFFAMTSIFAANINGDDPNNPVIYFNPEVQALMQTSQVKTLQNQHIKVLMTLLGNHENAGWSCMTNKASAQAFAKKIVNMVNQYHLDGVDIDDEYSACAPNNTSMIMLAQAIKTNPEFSGKLLTKALFSDYDIFSSTYEGHTLAEYLDYGWQMSYLDANFSNRLNFYKQHGMTSGKLMMGGWTQVYYPDASSIGTYTRNNNLPGAMIYDIRKDSQAYLSQLAKSEYGSENVFVSSECLVLGK